ncbi:histidinol-phosphate aminotransferase [Buchnera aphidicola (Nipponaphis monzeni)]|uniref:Histidinol-phosphate aminotransferase n=1 Tax=Buchnera aphidicola (Nipponaphis monzeni) TaxID=2495405 RepID=A0A455T9U5_9GAMM|nr:histidinol-phosphate transaminase [Buchnera aphidicola]BBI01099.1 histidinol-phosphate aminotransferase [Buchnera aphidicola (Nipponaphis monzeni)]
MFDLYKLTNSSILKLIPYQSARKIGGTGNIWINANESPYPFKSRYKHQKLNRYPDPQPVKIIDKYSSYSNVQNDEILITRGADEGINLLITAFCNPLQDAIIVCPPTYDMYAISGKINSINIYEIPMLKNWQLDLKNIQLVLKTIKIIFICRPNNPTGNLINKDDIKNLLQVVNNNTIVVIDEAYIEFCIEHTLVSWIQKYPNLVILRTLSKAFGLAGLRCGFVLARNSIIKLLNKVISPYPISTPVINIVNEALSNFNINLMKKKVLQIKKNRDLIYIELKKLNCVKNVFISNTNYILVQFYLANKIFNKLSLEGIIVRDQNSKKYLKECLRISIGSKNECYKLINNLKIISQNLA